jgi:serine/threonine-protein kinase
VGLVHRDIKPGNLLVSADGTVKITDFGIAYAAGSAPLTRTGALIGTPAYLAPERVTGASAGPACDLYSLGIVAYECLTGAQPFAGTPMEVALAHQYQSLPPLPPAVPLPVAALVAELTARDPAGRPADAGEVAARAARLRDALNGAQAEEGPWLASAASGDERWSAATRMEPGDRRLDGVTLRDVGLQGAGMHGAGMYGLEPPGQRGARHSDRRRLAGGRTLLALAAAAVAVIVGLTGWMLVSGASGAPPAPSHQAARHPTGPPTTPPSMVTVNADALVGQSYTDVVQQLGAEGLQVKLKWVASDQDHGTVLSVSPAGPVPKGATVTVTVAGHHHGGDGGNGNGNGNGGG